ncbi:unnamed protein product [Toxocara canis]|uniref:G_PROTEIN_RECEP_F1_2 domain-containing protein n=1 Tax=Toxocara canis TaxID=6265 RepID=A0A183TVI9_TOXCA|nr:unnamed protein product [Toxocara canis]
MDFGPSSIVDCFLLLRRILQSGEFSELLVMSVGNIARLAFIQQAVRPGDGKCCDMMHTELTHITVYLLSPITVVIAVARSFAPLEEVWLCSKAGGCSDTLAQTRPAQMVLLCTVFVVFVVHLVMLHFACVFDGVEVYLKIETLFYFDSTFHRVTVLGGSLMSPTCYLWTVAYERNKTDFIADKYYIYMPRGNEAVNKAPRVVRIAGLNIRKKPLFYWCGLQPTESGVAAYTSGNVFLVVV